MKKLLILNILFAFSLLTCNSSLAAIDLNTTNFGFEITSDHKNNTPINETNLTFHWAAALTDAKDNHYYQLKYRISKQNITNDQIKTFVNDSPNDVSPLSINLSGQQIKLFSLNNFPIPKSYVEDFVTTSLNSPPWSTYGKIEGTTYIYYALRRITKEDFNQGKFENWVIHDYFWNGTQYYAVGYKEFNVDFTPPTPPSIKTLQFANNNLDVSWDASTDVNKITYYYLIDPAKKDANEIIAANNKTDTTSASIPFTPQGNFYFNLVAVDEAGNTSPVVEQLFSEDRTPPTIAINGSNTEIEVSYHTQTVVITTEVKDNEMGIAMFETKYTMSNDIKPLQTTILTQETNKRWKLQFTYNLPIGQYIFTVNTKDLKGNQSSLKQTINILSGITDITITSPSGHIKDSWNSSIPAIFAYAAQTISGTKLAAQPYFYKMSRTQIDKTQVINEAKKQTQPINPATPYNQENILYGPTDQDTWIQFFDPKKEAGAFDSNWHFYVVAKDDQGNYFVKEHKFGIDNSNPTGSLIFKDQKKFTNTTKGVTLQLDASAPSGIKLVKIRNSNSVSYTSKNYDKNYATTGLFWDLTDGEGEKEVQAYYVSNVIKDSEIYKAKITVDTTPPTISSNILSPLYVKEQTTIEWQAQDLGNYPSGIKEYYIMGDVPNQTLKQPSYTFKNLAEGKYYYNVFVIDNAENVAFLLGKKHPLSLFPVLELICDRTPPDLSKSNLKIEGAIDNLNSLVIGAKECVVKWAPATDLLSGVYEYIIQYKRLNSSLNPSINEEPDSAYNLPDHKLLTILHDTNKTEYSEKIVFPENQGAFLLRLVALDKCGNEANLPSKSIEVDPNSLIQKFSLTEFPQQPDYIINFELVLNPNLSNSYWLYLGNNKGKLLTNGQANTASEPLRNIIDPIKEGSYKFTLEVLDKKGKTTTVEKYVIIDTTPPKAIDTITAYADNSRQITLEENKPYGYENPYFEWPAPADNLSGIQGYLVGLSEDINKEPTDTITEAKYQAKDLISGKTYYLNVKALDKAGLTSKIKTFTYYMPQPEKISIQDKGISIVRGAKFIFSAKAYDSKNQEISGYSNFSWEKTEGEGSINKDTGEFTASNTLGKVKIKAVSDNGKTDEIEINITEEPIKIEIDPAQGAKTATDQSFTFTVIGKDAANNTVIINPTWSATPAPASIQASGNKGIFSANQKGTYTVIAIYNQLKASANIEVFQADHTPPEAFNLLEPSNQKRINKEEPLTLKWEFTKDDPHGSGMDKYEVILNGTKIGETDAKTNTYTVPAKDLKDGTYTWTIAAFDNLGNKREAAPFTFIVNIKGPIIIVKADNRELVNGDIINANPKFTIEIEDANGVKKDSVKLMFNGKAVSQGLSIQSVSGASSNSIVASYAPTDKLSEGKNTLFIEAYDTENYKTEREIKDLTVMAGLSIIGSPRNYPNPFKPSRNESTNIVYTLSQDAEITLYLYNIAGEQVWRKILVSGQEGAHVGENTVIWDGKDFSGEFVGNGVYLLAITSGGKVLARGEIAVYE